MEKYNYTLTTELYSLEEYLELVEMDLEEQQAVEGACRGAVSATLVDETTGYAMRICRTVYAMHALAIAEATTAATLAILEDYFTYLHENRFA